MSITFLRISVNRNPAMRLTIGGKGWYNTIGFIGKGVRAVSDVMLHLFSVARCFAFTKAHHGTTMPIFDAVMTQ